MPSRELIDTPELRQRRRDAVERGECMFNTTVTMACTGLWTSDDFANVAIFHDPELTGFLPTAKFTHKGTL